MHISLEGHKFNYEKIGSGEKSILMFHGFGQKGIFFDPLVKELLEEYTCYTFDLFFHGDSQWNRNAEYLKKGLYKNFLSAFFHKHKINHFSVVGFSMGGRFSLVACELFPHKIDNVVLMAPDGIKTSFWYSMATYPTFMRKLFKRTIHHPQIYLGLVKTLKKSNLVDKGILKFVNTQMDTKRKRMKVYFSWVVFSKLVPDIKKIIHFSNDYKFPIHLILGDHDKIITKENIQFFIDKLDNASITIVKSGHSNLICNSTKVAKRLLFKQSH